ncbi:MAG: preprotein translocase subunit SecY [Rubinisphaera brasiliensis]|uniref:Protein translocase subunit SecY n=1 Tax=Rubinisphaera brasiliensis (strain ATCC 49424 / DSM 5305 / JCM 21570 / IAM 15109 / NBRC 103401 / IFAM 1448) TaxID=756272 RepID=F0SJA4_RUBBR|nr:MULTISPECIES: preprotein translocase subunit SecY [Rubinisphaera]ADY59679.1 protein translocase subunit secY/sec61 alpha [Rubinisphaera brasiliensis DSM 5305]MBR9803441.1 preprotein translocase subunit SecY [bacterium]
MFEKLITLFRIPELRNKILLTIGLLAVYRLGFWIPLPFIDQELFAAQMEKLQQGSGGFGQVIQMVSLFSASNLGNSTIFGLGIMPYISASIIFQLMGSVYPPLEQLQKEGEAGRKKINEYTRYATVVICLLQSFFWIRAISSGFGAGGGGMIMAEYNYWLIHLMGALVMTAGTIFLMWLGEQIDEYGIGNGISLLIMAGILAQMPTSLYEYLQPAFENGIRAGTGTGIDKLLLLLALFIGVVVGVIAMTQGQRRIPIQSAKHVRGRRVMGGQRQYLPLRVNQAGVMPIIFASSLLMFPYFIFSQASAIWPTSMTLKTLASAFGSGRGFLYNMSYVALIYFFCYFWTAITFNPKDMANNLKDYGSFIPGYRPGTRTATYLEQVMVRITFVGAGFLAIVAIIPTIVARWMNIPFMLASFYGGTGLLIVVSVALDLVQKIDSHLVMRNYRGMLESDEG